VSITLRSILPRAALGLSCRCIAVPAFPLQAVIGRSPFTGFSILPAALRRLTPGWKPGGDFQAEFGEGVRLEPGVALAQLGEGGPSFGVGGRGGVGRRGGEARDRFPVGLEL
jgi:hypothetical protein